MRIVVAGCLINAPLGGMAFHYIQYLIGLKKLGHEVLYLEESDNYASCYNPSTNEMTTDPAYGINFISELFSFFDINATWAYFNEHKSEWHGKSHSEVKSFAQSADIFINVSGLYPLKELFYRVPIRIFVDTDPAFTQVRHILNATRLEKVKNWHTHFFTFGENFGQPECKIPDDGLPWIGTRQPVVLDIWKSTSLDKPTGQWSTVMQWDSYNLTELNGKIYGMKSLSFKEFQDLPTLTSERFKLALWLENPTRKTLEDRGWQIENPLEVTKSPQSYQKFINDSKGEWTVAKHGYVISNSGWFSERSCNYLAAGRPLITQDTGFKTIFPVGNGLFTFSGMEDIFSALEAVNSDYEKHSKAAKEIATEYFNSEIVLKKLLSNIS